MKWSHLVALSTQSGVDKKFVIGFSPSGTVSAVVSENVADTVVRAVGIVRVHSPGTMPSTWVPFSLK